MIMPFIYGFSRFFVWMSLKVVRFRTLGVRSRTAGLVCVIESQGGIAGEALQE